MISFRAFDSEIFIGMPIIVADFILSSFFRRRRFMLRSKSCMDRELGRTMCLKSLSVFSFRILTSLMF